MTAVAPKRATSPAAGTGTAVPKWLRTVWLPVLVHVVALVLWQAAAMTLKVPEYILPSPLKILGTLGTTTYGWVPNTIVTAVEIFGGYLLGVVGGVGLAMVFAWSPATGVALMPLFVTLNMIPKVALGPLVVAWFSFGVLPNMLIVFSICFFPILLTTLRGLREVDPDLLNLVKSLRGTRWQLFRKIQLPGALPYIFSGMKVSAILAVAGAIVGEFIASERGLGYLMIQVQSSLDTAAMLMAIGILTLIGMALYAAVLVVEQLVIVKDERIEP